MTPGNRFARLGWSRWPLRLRVAVVCAVLLAPLWGVIVRDLRLHEQRTRDDDRHEVETVAQIGAQALLGTARAMDLLLLGLREHWRLTPTLYAEIVRRRQIQAEIGVGFDVVVIGPDGRSRFNTVADSWNGTYVGDRAFFAYHRDSPDDDMYVSAPFAGRMSGRQVIGFTRKLLSDDGRFNGVLLLAVSPEYLSRAFGPVELGEGATVAVMRDDYRILMRALVSSLPSRSGFHLRITYPLGSEDPEPMFAPHFTFSQPDSFSTVYASPVDGILRQYSQRKAGFYPLRLVVGRPTALLDESLRLFRARYFAGGGLATVLLVVAVYWLMRSRQASGQALRVQTANVARLRRSETELHASRRTLRELSARQMALKEAERKRIAQEVHDELGQRLTVLRMDLSMLPRAVAADPARQLPAQVGLLKQSVDQILAIVRDIASKLRPAALDIGLSEAVAGLVEEFQDSLGIPCGFDNRLPPGLNIDETRSTAVFRIVQEALTNAARHARAQHIDVSLSLDATELRVRVHDDGHGFVPELNGTSSSLGLSGIRERAVALAGSVEVLSAPGEGTTIDARIPLVGRLDPATRIPPEHDPLKTVHSE